MYLINFVVLGENHITPNQKLLFCFRPESYVRLHRIDQCIPEMTSLKEEDAKWKINIKHEPGCALHIKSHVKIKKEPGCENAKPLKHYPGYTPQYDLSAVHDPGYTPAHDLSVVKHDPGYTPAHDLSVVKHDPGYTPAHDLSVVKHDPGYTPAHDLSAVHDPGYTPAHDLSVVKHDPGYTPAHDLSVVKHDRGYTPAHDLSVVHDWTVKVDDDGDGVIDLTEIIKAEPDESDGKTDEKCKNKEKETGE